MKFKLQWRLRTLAAVVAVAALIFAHLGREVHNAWANRLANAIVDATAERVWYEHEDEVLDDGQLRKRPLREIDLDRWRRLLLGDRSVDRPIAASFDAADITPEELKRLKSLQIVTFTRDSHLTNHHIEALATLPLRSLAVSDNALGDDNRWSSLLTMPELRVLSLRNCDVESESLSNVDLPKLRRMEIWGVAFTDARLRGLVAGAPRVHSIQLISCDFSGVSPAGMAWLSKLPLNSLWIAHPSVDVYDLLSHSSVSLPMLESLYILGAPLGEEPLNDVLVNCQLENPWLHHRPNWIVRYDFGQVSRHAVP